MPKIVPKLSKSVLNMFWGNFFETFFCPVFLGGSSLRNVFKKFKIFQNFQKCPNSFPKVSKRVLNMFWGIFFKKFFCPVFHGGSSLRNVFKKSKNFQNSKNAQNPSQNVQTCFEHVLRYSFQNFFLPSFPWRVESSKCFQKIENTSKFPKMPKIVPKSVQTCFERVLGYVFWKLFCPVFHGGSSLRNVFVKK